MQSVIMDDQWSKAAVLGRTDGLLARDRISLVLDQDSPFLELAPFAGHKLDNSTPCANLIAGIGSVWCVHTS